MPITTADIEFRLSGGTANTSPSAALGGVMATGGGGLVSTTALGAIFDNVTGDESAAGDVEYRCIYVKNNHGSLTWQAPKLWISSETPSADTQIDLALAGEGKGNGATTGVAETIANESTAPSGEAFSHPVDKAGGLALPDLAPGEAHAIWLRRTVAAGAAAVNGDGFTIRVEGDTAA